MPIRVGYACLALGVPEGRLTTCAAKAATPARLREIIAQNLEALLALVLYNAENGIRLFRISSDLIPFGSSPVNTLRWEEEFAPVFARIGTEIARTGLRVSMHPGQYTVLNSPDPAVAARAAEDLRYHEKVLSLLGAGRDAKLILHVGGVYGDKRAAMRRFCENWEKLDENVRRRLALENDERCYHIGDVLELSGALGIPVVFDCLHHALNPPPVHRPEADGVRLCARTWRPGDGRQKIHYSQQSPGGRPGAHSSTIRIAPFLGFCGPLREMELDVMLEVKDKNRSAVKCAGTLADAGLADAAPPSGALAREWERCRFSVLERSPALYGRIDAMLRAGVGATDFYEAVERAMERAPDAQGVQAAARRAFEALTEPVPPGEKKRFEAALEKVRAGGAPAPLKRLLCRLAARYGGQALLHGYYFAQPPE